MKNKVNEYCITYSYITMYETEWFRAKSSTEAVEHIKDIVGKDVKIGCIIGRPHAKKRDSKTCIR